MSSFPFSELPPYLTLLLTGALAPSCPLHVSLAHLAFLKESPAARPKVLIVTAVTQDAFKAELEAYNDAWLNEYSLKGAWASLLASIEIFYAASPSQLRLVLSLLRPASIPNSRLPGAPANAAMDVTPNLVILHDISRWFVGENRLQSHVLSDYLRLVTMGLDFSRYLSLLQETTPTKFALIDGGLSELRLPVVVRTPKEPGPNASDRQSEVAPPTTGQTQELLLPLIGKYIDWIGVVGKYPSPPSTPVAEPDFGSPTHKLNLRRSTLLSGVTHKVADERIYEWREDRAQLGEFNELSGTIITPF